MAHPTNAMYANTENTKPQLKSSNAFPSEQGPSNGIQNGASIPLSGVQYFTRPQPPLYVETRYNTTNWLGESHQQAIDIFKTSDGKLICRHGPCVTCLCNWQWNSAMASVSNNWPRQYFPHLQFVNQNPGNVNTQSAAPQQPTQLRMQPLMQPGHTTNNTVHPQPGQVYPRTNTNGPLVNQETPLYESTVIRNQNHIVSGYQPMPRINMAPNPPINGRPRRRVNFEKVLRIQEWRTQVEPESTPTLNDEQSETEEGNHKLRLGDESSAIVKRKADVEYPIEDPSDSKRIKLETEDTPARSSHTTTETTLVRQESKVKACVACRGAHKKCDGRYSACKYAHPEANLKSSRGTLRKIRQVESLAPFADKGCQASGSLP